jgi:hypothetical protein
MDHDSRQCTLRDPCSNELSLINPVRSKAALQSLIICDGEVAVDRRQHLFQAYNPRMMQYGSCIVPKKRSRLGSMGIVHCYGNINLTRTYT